MEYFEILKNAEKYISEETEQKFIDEVKSLIEKKDEKELFDRFYRDLEFGTAGLRGIIGGGTNRMNPNVIKKATQGLASYLIKAKPDKAKAGTLKAVIAFDSRHYSDVFAKTAALIFAANGIKCFLFSALRPTPELSYSIRELGCDTGIVITASHNPPAYNGYKVYWTDGAQITPPHDKGIIDEVNNVTAVKIISEDEAEKNGKLQIIGSEIDEKYWTLLKNRITRSQIIKEMSKTVKIVYTPLHGTGAMHIEKVLGGMGFNVITVPEQREPDGNFPTVSYPNPEDPKALKMAIELAGKENADILMATDPDSDRFACAVKDKDNKMQLISGNQLGALFTDYLCLTLKENGNLPANAAVVRSIVTSPLSDFIASSYGVKTVECLTGFKWICGIAEQMVQTGSNSYIYGYEESFGYNFGTEIRDKDGIAASAICAEMTLYWKSKGKSLIDRLNELFTKFSYYGEKTINMAYPGAEGLTIMKNMMKEVRSKKLSEIAGVKVKKIRDIEESIEFNPYTPEEKTSVNLPKSNVLQYYLEDDTVICIRPSGTEPKIKLYIIHPEKVISSVEEAKTVANTKIEEFEKYFNGVLNA